ncbi:hypothetical protein ABK040_007575 [Willaertia magna]
MLLILLILLSKYHYNNLILNDNNIFQNIFKNYNFFLFEDLPNYLFKLQNLNMVDICDNDSYYLLYNFTNLKSLKIDFKYTLDLVHDFNFNYINKLKELYLFNCHLQNETNLSTLPQLEILHISDSYFTDEHLKDLINLTELNIKGKYSEFNGKYFYNLKKLKKLKLNYTFVIDENLKKLINLTELELFENNNLIGTCFENLLNLEKLDICCNYNDNVEFKFQNYLDKLINLKYLHINEEITNFTFLKKLINLETLILIGNCIKDEDLYNLKKLKFLKCYGSEIDGNCFEYLPFLEELECDLNRIKNLNYLQNIKRIKAREKIIPGNHIKDETLQKLTNIIELDISDSKMTGNCLLALQNLTSLNIDKTKIKDENLQNLKHIIVATSNVVTWGSNIDGQIPTLSIYKTAIPQLGTWNRKDLIIKEIVNNEMNEVNHLLTEDGKVFTSGYYPYFGGLISKDYISCDWLEVNKDNWKGKVVSLTSIYYAIFALLDNGDLYGWGEEGNALCDEDKTRFCLGNREPKQISFVGTLLEGKKITKITARNKHVIVLADDGKLYSWGENKFRVLGNGNFTDVMTNSPIIVNMNGVDGKVIHLSAATNSFFIVTDKNSVYAWGVINPSETNKNILEAAKLDIPIKADETIVKISNSYGSILILTDKGTVYQWSTNVVTPQTNKDATITQQLSSYKVVDISLGYDVSYVLLNNGNIFAWGQNSSYALGPSMNDVVIATIADVPIQIQTKYINGKVSNIYGGTNRVIVQTENKELWGWGYSMFYCLIADRSVPIVSTPRDLSIDLKRSMIPAYHTNETILFKDISVSHSNGIGIIYNMSKVITWGANFYGQLGTGFTSGDQSKHVYEVQQLPATNSGATPEKAYCIFSSCFVIYNNGKVYSFGYNGEGQLGNGDFISKSLPVQLNTNELKEDEKIIQIVGYTHILAVTDKGNVFAWGHGQGGSLGNAAQQNSNVPISITKVASLLKDKKIVMVSAGTQSSLALSADGKVYGWGNNEWGQLGKNPSTLNYMSPIQIDFSGTEFEKSVFVKIVSGADFNLFLTNDGKVAGLGRSLNSQLGFKGETFKPIKLPFNEEIKDISSNFYTTFAITKSNKMLCIGSNLKGECGIGNSSIYGGSNDFIVTVPTPVLVSNVNDGNKLITGPGTSFYLTSYCSGIISSDVKVCSGRGSCIGFDFCKCKDGFSGLNCENIGNSSEASSIVNGNLLSFVIIALSFILYNL